MVNIYRKHPDKVTEQQLRRKMKNIIPVVLIAIVFASLLKAQPLQQSFAMGGTVKYLTNSSDVKDFGVEYDGEYSHTEVNIGPRLCYFSSEHFMYGISLGYSWGKETTEYSSFSQISSSIKTEIFYINPFLRVSQYVSDYCAFFSELALTHGFGERERRQYYGASRNSDISKIKYDITTTALSLNPGVLFVVNSKIAVDASLGILYFAKTSTEVTEPQLASATPREENIQYGLSFDLRAVNIGVIIIL